MSCSLASKASNKASQALHSNEKEVGDWSASKTVFLKNAASSMFAFMGGVDMVSFMEAINFLPCSENCLA